MSEQAPEPSAEPETEESKEEPSLDELLNDFEEPKPAPEEPEKPKGDMDRIVSFVDRMEAKEAKDETDSGISEAVKLIQSDEKAANQSERMISGFLHAMANENPSFLKAFENRQQNPAAWKKAQGMAKTEFLKDISLPDDKITDDLEAAQASVRGASTNIPDKPEVSNADLTAMNDQQFEAHKKTLG